MIFKLLVKYLYISYIFVYERNSEKELIYMCLSLGMFFKSNIFILWLFEFKDIEFIYIEY